MAAANNRFALVMGCDNYPLETRLKKAVGDAREIYELLQDAKFSCKLLTDPTHDQMILAQSQLVDKVGHAAKLGHRPIVVVFFSGHGVDIDGKTHLLPKDHFCRPPGSPVGGELQSFDEPEFRGGLLVDALISELNRAGDDITIILLSDACRYDPENNMFRSRAQQGEDAATIAAQDWGVTVGVRGGLMPFSQAVAHQLTRNNRYFLGFACKAGTVAMEPKDGAHGYFTQALLDHLRLNSDLLAVFRKVMDQVEKETARRQGPYFETNLVTELCLFSGEVQQQLPPASAVGKPPAAAENAAKKNGIVPAHAARAWQPAVVPPGAANGHIVVIDNFNCVTVVDCDAGTKLEGYQKLAEDFWGRAFDYYDSMNNVHEVWINIGTPYAQKKQFEGGWQGQKYMETVPQFDSHFNEDIWPKIKQALRLVHKEYKFKPATWMSQLFSCGKYEQTALAEYMQAASAALAGVISKEQLQKGAVRLFHPTRTGRDAVDIPVAGTATGVDYVSKQPARLWPPPYISVVVDADKVKWDSPKAGQVASITLQPPTASDPTTARNGVLVPTPLSTPRKAGQPACQDMAPAELPNAIPETACDTSHCSAPETSA